MVTHTENVTTTFELVDYLSNFLAWELANVTPPRRWPYIMHARINLLKETEVHDNRKFWKARLAACSLHVGMFFFDDSR
jgi:hypothetical protein